MPDVVSKLLAIHLDDGRGRCVACRSPGRGTPNAAWPCGITVIARLAARRIAAARVGRDGTGQDSAGTARGVEA
jgi:hypothetical protein